MEVCLTHCIAISLQEITVVHHFVQTGNETGRAQTGANQTAILKSEQRKGCFLRCNT